ncbi:MAG TPA: AAA family ATPase [Gemmata sp.]
MNHIETAPPNPLPAPPKPRLHIPERHEETILSHLARNFQNLPGPLMLAIDGPPGVGKTFAVETTLNRAKVMRVILTGADLESGEAGRPADLVRRWYLKAAATIAAGKPAAVVLDDFDAAVGRWDANTTYTVNTQLIYTELMHLADSPTLVEDRKVRRVPIILTCNNIGRLYAPLCRPGRMQIHPWTMTPGERIEIVQGIFYGLDPDAIIDLLTAFPKHPVAFFADLRRRAEEDGVRAAVRRYAPAEAVRQALQGKLEAAPRALLTKPQLIALGRRMEAEMIKRNHLEIQK